MTERPAALRNWPDKTPAETLGRVTTPAEMFTVGPSGDLMI